MTFPQLKLDFIDTTEDHVRGFAHVHPMERREQSIEHVSGTTWLARQMLQRESYTLEAPDLGTLIFDVTSIKLVLARRLPPFRMVRAHLTQEWADYTCQTCGVEEAGIARHDLAALDRPGIMVWFGEGRSAQIDGAHRLVRSFREGRPTYDMALVDSMSISPFMCRPGGESVMFDVAKALEEELGLLSRFGGKKLAEAKYMWKTEGGREIEI